MNVIFGPNSINFAKNIDLYSTGSLLYNLATGISGNSYPIDLGSLVTSITGTQLVYINKSGNDAIADGTLVHPFSTINKAIESITDAGGEKIYSIIIGAGDYNEDVKTKNGLSVFGDARATFVQSLNVIGDCSLVGIAIDNLTTFTSGASSRIHYCSFSDILISGGATISINGSEIGGSIDASGNASITIKASDIGGINLNDSVQFYTDSESIPSIPENITIADTVTITFLDKANYINFLPINIFNWTGDYTNGTISQALDELASRIKALEPI